MEVVFYEVFEEEKKELKKHLPKNIQADFREGTLQSYTEKHLPAKVISIRTQSIIPLDWHEKLQAVFTRSSGTDHLKPLMRLQNRSLQMGYLPNYCARSVAEYAILMILALLKKLKKQINHFNHFNRNGLTGHNCLNCNVLVVGVGKIGSQIVKLAKSLGMIVRGVDIVQRIPTVEYVSLEDGLGLSDCVVCALPLNEDTNCLLNYKKLKILSPESIFINISRGEISPLADLERLLEENILSAIALDVYEHESELASLLQNDSRSNNEYLNLVRRLKDREDVIFTPHNAFNSTDDLEKKAELSCLALKTYSETGRFPEAIDESSFS